MFSNASSRDVPARAFAGGGEPAELRRAASSKDGPSSVGSSEPLVGAASPAAPRSIAARRAGVPPREPRSESTASLRRSSYSARGLWGGPGPARDRETGLGPGARRTREAGARRPSRRSKVVRRSFEGRSRQPGRARARPRGSTRRGLVLLLRPPRSRLLLLRRFRRGAPAPPPPPRPPPCRDAPPPLAPPPPPPPSPRPRGLRDAQRSSRAPATRPTAFASSHLIRARSDASSSRVRRSPRSAHCSASSRAVTVSFAEVDVVFSPGRLVSPGSEFSEYSAATFASSFAESVSSASRTRRDGALGGSPSKPPSSDARVDRSAINCSATARLTASATSASDASESPASFEAAVPSPIVVSLSSILLAAAAAAVFSRATTSSRIASASSRIALVTLARSASRASRASVRAAATAREHPRGSPRPGSCDRARAPLGLRSARALRRRR